MAIEHDDRLAARAGEKVAWLTTVTPSGRPAPRPVWFVVDGDDIIVFSRPDTAKLRHLAENGNVGFNFNSTAGGADVLVITGTSEVEPGAKPSEQPGYLEKYERSYPGIGLDAAGFDEAYSVRIRITPTRSWSF